MIDRRQTPQVSDLPPLRILMGGALAFAGGAVWHQADAQSNSEPPAESGPVELAPIPIEGGAGSGYRTPVPQLPKLSQPLLDTPQSINVVPREVMDDQGITATRDAHRTVPGISLAAGEAGAQGDNLTLRGFTARNDFYLDGMRDFGSYYRDPFDLQEIEVLKGPSSVLFGRGSTGGVIQQVSKQPQLAPLTAGSVAFGTDGTKRLTIDLDRPLEGITGGAIRLNLMGDLNGIAGRDVSQYGRLGIAPSVSFGLGTPTRITLSYLHQQEYNVPDYGLPWLFAAPAPVNRNNFYGFANSDYLRTQVDMGTIKVEHDFGDNVSIRNQFRYASYDRSIRVTEPQVIYTGVTPSTPLSAISVNRNMIAVTSQETFLDNQTDLTIRFNTGFVRHTLVSGVELGRETSSPIRTTFTGIPTTSLLVPNSDDVFAAKGSVSTNANTVSNTFGAYFVDTMTFGEHFEFSGGVRFDMFQTTFDQIVAPVVHLSRTDAMPGYRAALTYKPTANGRIYFAYGTSFNPSAEGLSLAANTSDLAPEKNETYELGTKWDILNEKLSVTSSIFQIEKMNARVPDPNNSAFNVLGGDQRVRGFELGVAGSLTDNWQIFAGYAYLCSKVIKSSVAASLGVPLANTPQNTFSLWTTWLLPWYSVQVGGGLQYVDRRLASTTPNTTTKLLEYAPGYVTAQLMAKAPIRPGLDVQLNAYNLTNTAYFDLLHPAHVVPGAGRSVLLSLNFRL
jgi:catecholate siderophore receptor